MLKTIGLMETTTMTEKLFLKDSHLKSCEARVEAITAEGGIVLNQSVFYATGGGQPGDSGSVTLKDGRSIAINTCIKGENDALVLLPADGEIEGLVAGDSLEAVLDWDRRFAHMAMHTSLHLLCASIDAGVTGGSIGAEKSRLDFDLEEAPDKEALEERLNALIAGEHDVFASTITAEELDAQPELVRTMSVAPPRDASGLIRVVRIGTEASPVDFQPCGGTHVANTREIGRVRIGKVEKKGKQNRRINIHWEPTAP